mmetsp:Transcript_17018/g.23674  ORF Transcript_17018/g.23674 Transcript_17018/m.23674 type:complete len:263 (+) Transcript_17018:48-836(+)
MQQHVRTIAVLCLSLCLLQVVFCCDSTHANIDQSAAITRIVKQKDINAVRQTFHQIFDWGSDLRNKNTSKPFFGSLCKNWLTKDAVYEFVDFATFTGCKEIQNKWYNHTRRAYNFIKHHISNDEIEVNGTTAKGYFSALVTAAEKKKARWMQLTYEVDFVKEPSETKEPKETVQQTPPSQEEASAVHEPSGEIQFASANETQVAPTEFPNCGGWKIKHLKGDFGFVSGYYNSWLDTKQPSWSKTTNQFVYKDKESEESGDRD